MKPLICLLLVFPLIFCGCGVTETPDLVSEISQIISESDVELVTEFYHHLQEVTVEYPNGDTLTEKYTYSEVENEFLNDYIGCLYFENSQQVAQNSYTRDKVGNIISRTNASGVTTYELTYDQEDRVIRKDIFQDGAAAGYEAYTYDPSGLLTEQALYGPEGVLETIFTEYADGHWTRITHYDGSGTITGYETCEFDAKKCKESVQQYDSSGALLGRQENALDIYGNVIVEEAYDSEGSLISTTRRSYLTGSVTYDKKRGYPGRD